MLEIIFRPKRKRKSLSFEVFSLVQHLWKVRFCNIVYNNGTFHIYEKLDFVHRNSSPVPDLQV